MCLLVSPTISMSLSQSLTSELLSELLCGWSDEMVEEDKKADEVRSITIITTVNVRINIQVASTLKRN